MLGNIVMKGNVKKVCCLYNDKVIVGFVGGIVDVFMLFELFECKLEMYQGYLVKVVVELVKDWCIDCMLCKFEVLLAVVDEIVLFIIIGNGDVVQLENDFIVIGFGGFYVQAAVCVLLENIEFSVCEIVEKVLDIVGDICIYINYFYIIEELSYKV